MRRVKVDQLLETLDFPLGRPRHWDFLVLDALTFSGFCWSKVLRPFWPIKMCHGFILSRSFLIFNAFREITHVKIKVSQSSQELSSSTGRIYICRVSYRSGGTLVDNLSLQVMG